ncbi:MAG: nitrogen regulation protein NR(II) [Xanthomonadaceae bacterium]|nr:nitrogen regulation protein NR(II) [Xanthomonadaceae bacterium]
MRKNEAERAPGILEGLNTAVLLLTPELALAYLNPAGENLLEQSARQALGQPLARFLCDDGGLLERLRASVDAQHPFTARELRLAFTPSRVVTVDCMVSPMDSGTVSGLLVELVPIDRHLRISREEQLIAQQQAARKLVRGLAHEIKNPLGGLRGAAQLLEAELPDAALKEYTRIIIGEADRLQNLVNRMLGPNNLPRPSATNIHQVVEHVRSLVLAEGGQAMTIRRDYDPSIPDLMVDPELLIQAVLNIVKNAGQAGATDILLRTSAQRQFTIGHVRHKLVVQLQIIDNGPGIPEGMMEQIFYPMVTGRAEGTGLGLSIAQSLVNQQGGIIECTSQPGRTEFSILLPLETHHE